jgi:hypothetical protein
MLIDELSEVQDQVLLVAEPAQKKYAFCYFHFIKVQSPFFIV